MLFFPFLSPAVVIIIFSNRALPPSHMSASSSSSALYVWPPAFTLPSLCPSSLYVLAYLRLAGIQHTPIPTSEPSRSPSSQLPCFDASPDASASSHVGDDAVAAARGCVDACVARGADLDAKATSAVSTTGRARFTADATAYLAMAEATLAPASQAALWIDPKTWTAVRDVLAPGMPVPLNWAVAYRMRRATQLAMPCRLEDVYASAVRGYDVLDRLLKAHPPGASSRFLLGGTQPTRLDAFAMAHVLFHLCAAPCAATPLREALDARPDLTRWATRLAADVFVKEGEAPFCTPMPLPPPPTPPPRQSESRGTSGGGGGSGKSASDEERAYRRGNILAVVSALGAMTLYALSSIEWVEDEDDEEPSRSPMSGEGTSAEAEAEAEEAEADEEEAGE